ncbi:muramoyltetrapeptide carboxypeptidase [Nonomuraea solani]|uniref:Muramoyltetrapeptide carboxypeptidase n=1 Tax=Nonomuraea solani TaxID=1144553 RepID=A0A1H6ES48_9ACTN|nr:LD-carboxypeptidase [Nonomuraea solani]SEH00680.1 muramoyltetrapeptide carboxypeptidase [Nonomuraea solani]
MQPADTVAIVSPSGPPNAVLLKRGIQRLEALGLKVVTGSHVLGRQRLDFLAGSDAERAADLQAAWCDPAVSAVFCSRGGYGAGRLLGLLDWDAMRAAGPKVLLGSSDITALHNAFAIELGVPTLHGPMAACDVLSGDEQGPEPVTWESLRAALFGTPLPVAGDRVLASGRAEGVVTGGNLSLLASMCGTRWQPSFDGKIVFLEDIAEEPYRIDRMLSQLLQAGAFDGVRGIALGSWVGCGDPYPVLEERLGPLGVPVVAGLPVGHGSPQWSVWFGELGAIDTESCSLAGPIRQREQAR